MSSAEVFYDVLNVGRRGITMYVLRTAKARTLLLLEVFHSPDGNVRIRRTLRCESHPNSWKARTFA
jgi:hypothetical protein